MHHMFLEDVLRENVKCLRYIHSVITTNHLLSVHILYITVFQSKIHQINVYIDIVNMLDHSKDSMKTTHSFSHIQD